LQHLKSFVEAAVARVTRSQIGELSVVDGGDQASYTAAVSSFPAAVAEVVYETGNAVGVDIKSLLGGAEGRQ
jgi:flotillin